MRYLLILLIAVAGMAVWQGCKTHKYTLDKYEGPRLTFGTGGGFTGMVKEFSLLSNGQIFMKYNNGDPVEQPKIKKKQAKKLFKMAEELQLLEKTYNHPGNKYYFIEFHKDGKEAKSVWGNGKQFMNPKLHAFYKEFMNQLLTKKAENTDASE